MLSGGALAKFTLLQRSASSSSAPAAAAAAAHQSQ